MTPGRCQNEDHPVIYPRGDKARPEGAGRVDAAFRPVPRAQQPERRPLHDLFDVSFLTWYTEPVRHRVPHRRTSVKLISTGKTLQLSGSLCFFILPAFLCRRSGCSLNAALICGFVLLPWPARKAAKTVKKGKISGVFVAVSMPYFSAAGVPPLNDFCTINRYLRKVWHGVGRDPLRCPRRPPFSVSAALHTGIFINK